MPLHALNNLAFGNHSRLLAVIHKGSVDPSMRQKELQLRGPLILHLLHQLLDTSKIHAKHKLNPIEMFVFLLCPKGFADPL